MKSTLFSRLNLPLHIRLLTLLLVSAVMTGCGSSAPGTGEIFDNPAAGTQFDSASGEVRLSGLSSTTVCYTTDGTTPKNSKGDCGDGSTQEYAESILLECGEAEYGESVAREVKLAFVWRSNVNTTMEYRSAEFFLDCGFPEETTDADGDGFDDDVDNCPNVSNLGQEDENADGVGDACDDDDDGDGVENDSDNCRSDVNEDQNDQDLDGFGNACDADIDGDGFLNDLDNCPNAPNPGQEDDDSDGVGNICDPLTDTDGDGVANEEDNCPDHSNPEQEDEFEDGIGDICDLDHDSVLNEDDNCPNNLNSEQEDADADGVGDACDTPITDKFFNSYVRYQTELLDMLCVDNRCTTSDGFFDYSIDDSNSELGGGEASIKTTFRSLSSANIELTVNDAIWDDCEGNGSASGVADLSDGTQLGTENPINFSCGDQEGGSIKLDLELSGITPIDGSYDVYCLNPGCESTTVRFSITRIVNNIPIYSREVLETVLE